MQEILDKCSVCDHDLSDREIEIEETVCSLCADECRCERCLNGQF